MSKPKTKIAKIVINLNGEELELSPKQARELRDILCEMYGEKTVKNIHEYHHYDWNRPWPYTTWVTTSGYSVSSTETLGGGSSNIIGDTTGLIGAIDPDAITSDTVYLTAVA